MPNELNAKYAVSAIEKLGPCSGYDADFLGGPGGAAHCQSAQVAPPSAKCRQIWKAKYAGCDLDVVSFRILQRDWSMPVPDLSHGARFGVNSIGLFMRHVQEIDVRVGLKYIYSRSCPFGKRNLFFFVCQEEPNPRGQTKDKRPQNS